MWWKDKRQMIILCGHVDFNAYWVNVLYIFSKCHDVGRFEESVSCCHPGAERTANLCEVYVVDTSRLKKRNYMIQENSNL